jgi:uncharacterized membrane protein (Fun14 family)
MADRSKSESGGGDGSGGASNHRKRVGKKPAWVWLLVVVSVGLMAAGLLLPMFASDVPQGGSGAARGGVPVSGFAGEASVPGVADDARSALHEWSPAIFRLGFSFFAGFAVAAALRVAFKFAVVAAGFVILAVLGLQYAGLVNVNWNSVSDQYESVAAYLGGQFKSFSAFAQGVLPSASAAGVGLVAGWRRR